MSRLNMYIVYSGLSLVIILLIVMFIFCFKGVKETFQINPAQLNYNISGYQFLNGQLMAPGDLDSLTQYRQDVEAARQQKAASDAQLAADKARVTANAQASTTWQTRLKSGNVNAYPAGPPVTQWPYPQLAANMGSNTVTVCPFAGCVGVGPGNIYGNPGYGTVVVTGADYYDPNNQDNQKCLNVNLDYQDIPPGYIQPGTPCI